MVVIFAEPSEFACNLNDLNERMVCFQRNSNDVNVTVVEMLCESIIHVASGYVICFIFRFASRNIRLCVVTPVIAIVWCLE